MYRYLLPLLLATAPLVAEVRLAVDIGSATTTYEIANVVRGKIVEHLQTQEARIPVEEDIKQSGTDVLTDKTTVALKALLSKALEAARQEKATRYAVVATGAFLNAKNAKGFVEEIQKELGLEIQLIDQSDEARLSFGGVAAITGIQPARLVVWDLGGGTMEIASRSSIFLSDLGSTEFRAMVVREIKNENPLAVLTPNPLTEEQIQSAVVLARKQAEPIDAPLRRQLKAPRTHFVGMGALSSLQADSAKPNLFTLEELKTSLHAKIDKTDKELGDAPFVNQYVTDLALAVGFLEELSVDRIATVNITLTTGLLLTPDSLSSMPDEPKEKL